MFIAPINAIINLKFNLNLNLCQNCEEDFLVAKEIERKFLVRRELWRPSAEGTRICQGYLSTDPKRVVRVRMMGENAFLTIKGQNEGLARLEFEYAIPGADAKALLKLCALPPLNKIRYRENIAGKVWEIDEFFDANAGLLVAEIELTAVDEGFVRPEWLGEEVSYDERYFNSNLIVRPYTTWA